MNNDLFLSTSEFLELFKKTHEAPSGKPFCWILGSGASRQSGIRMGRDLAKLWLNEMYDADHSPQKPSIEEWANKEFADIPGFEYGRAVNFYAYVYQRRYKADPSEGYSFLEAEIEKASPSVGYSVLAQIMAGTPDKVAITTNFDDLLSHALVTYAGILPFDSGHDSLPSYVSLNLRRPIIAKLHRDLLLAPKTGSEEIAKLPQEWEESLTSVFEHYTPIIVGFGDTDGSGGSLMRFFEKLAPISGGLFWCYREKVAGAKPADEVQSLVQHHNGHLVPILGFDEFMLQLWDELLLTSLHHELQERYSGIASNYLTQFSHVAQSIVALSETVDTETVKSAAQSASSVLKRLSEDAF